MKHLLNTFQINININTQMLRPLVLLLTPPPHKKTKENIYVPRIQWTFILDQKYDYMNLGKVAGKLDIVCDKINLAHQVYTN